MNKTKHDIAELFRSDIEEISSPLVDGLGLHSFAFQRFYDDGKLLFTSTAQAEFNQIYLEKNLYPSYDEVMNCPIDYSILSCSSDLNTPINNQEFWYQNIQLAEQFGIPHRFFILKKFSNYYEIYSFNSNAKNHEVSSLFLGNLDVLTKFTSYFKTQAASIIEKKSKHLIRLDSQHFFGDKPIDPMSNERSHLIKTIGNSTSALSYNLTPRETQCMKGVVAGFSAKEIAQTTGLTPRTIESYIASLKAKCGVSTKRQLRALWEKNFIE